MRLRSARRTGNERRLVAVDAPRRGDPSRQSKQRSTPMKLGSLPRGLAVAAVAAVTVVPLAASAAAAAPAAPTAYTVYGSAAPLSWAGSSSIAVGDLHVPFVAGKSNNLAFANSNAFLADPDATETSKTM